MHLKPPPITLKLGLPQPSIFPLESRDVKEIVSSLYVLSLLAYNPTLAFQINCLSVTLQQLVHPL